MNVRRESRIALRSPSDAKLKFHSHSFDIYTHKFTTLESTRNIHFYVILGSAIEIIK